MEEEQPLYAKNPYQKNFTLYLIFSVFVVIIGSSQFGFSTTAPNYVVEGITGRNLTQPILDCNVGKGFIKPCVFMSTNAKTLFLSSIYFGSIVGSLFGGFLSDFIERRTSILISNSFFIIGNLFLSLFSNYVLLVIGQVTIGIGVGIVSVVIPIYLMEIASPKYRGAICSFHQVGINITIFIGQLLSLVLNQGYFWRILFIFPIALAIFQNLLLPYIPMSPRWLILSGWRQTAESELIKLRGTTYIEEELKSFDNYDNEKQKFSIKSLYKRLNFQVFKRLFICSSLHFFQQFCGVNLIIFIGSFFFTKIRLDSSAYFITIINLSNVFSSLVCTFTIEKFGRKKLLITSEIITFLSFVVFLFSYVFASKDSNVALDILVGISLIIFILGYSLGLGPVPWIMMTELFPSDIRGIACGLISSVNWVCTLIVSIISLFVTQDETPYILLIFPISTFISFFFTYFLIEDTTGKTLEEINENLNQ